MGEIQSAVIESLSDLEKWVRDFLPLLKTKSVICLSGGLGAGKTTTVNYLLSAMGFHSVTSPTYALHQKYELKNFDVDHFDLYRIENSDDLESVGFWDTFMKKSGWIIVEWPEKIEINDLPKDWCIYWVKISQTSNHRVFQLSFV